MVSRALLMIGEQIKCKAENMHRMKSSSHSR